MMKRPDIQFGLFFGVLFLSAVWQQWIPVSPLEACAFVTGVVCVYLIILENIWNYPAGLVTCLFLLILFIQARLYGDAALQIVSIALGFHGWYQWLYGGEQKTALSITRASWRLLLVMVVVVALLTWGGMLALRAVQGAAPLLDSFTTALSLAAQYLLNRKAIENYWFFIVANILYLYLYISRGLPVTAVLYFVFLCLCVVGLIRWGRTLRAQDDLLSPGQPQTNPYQVSR